MAEDQTHERCRGGPRGWPAASHRRAGGPRVALHGARSARAATRTTRALTSTAQRRLDSTAARYVDAHVTSARPPAARGSRRMSRHPGTPRGAKGGTEGAHPSPDIEHPQKGNPMAEKHRTTEPGWADNAMEKARQRHMNRIVIAVPSEQLTPDIREGLARLGAKVITHPNPALLIEHLLHALKLV